MVVEMLHIPLYISLPWSWVIVAKDLLDLETWWGVEGWSCSRDRFSREMRFIHVISRQVVVWSQSPCPRSSSGTACASVHRSCKVAGIAMKSMQCSLLPSAETRVVLDPSWISLVLGRHRSCASRKPLSSLVLEDEESPSQKT